jgi:hypothetical protein
VPFPFLAAVFASPFRDGVPYVDLVRKPLDVVESECQRFIAADARKGAEVGKRVPSTANRLITSTITCTKSSRF